MSEADTATVTADDVSGLNQAVVERAANLARLIGTGLLVVAGLTALAWGWVTLRALGLLGEAYADFPDLSELGLDDQIDILVNYVVLLVYASLAAGLGTGLRLAADYTVARTGGSLTGVRAGEPLDGDGETGADGEPED